MTKPVYWFSIAIVALLIIHLSIKKRNEDQVAESSVPLPKITSSNSETDIGNLESVIVNDAGVPEQSQPPLTIAEQVEDATAAGLSVGGGLALASRDPHSTLSINDFPPKIQMEIKEELANLQANGYSTVDSHKAGEIVDVGNNIVGSDHTQSNALFELSKLPEAILSNYEYVGYTIPGYSIDPSVTLLDNSTIRRVFSHNDSILIVQESAMNRDTHEIFVDVFVNSDVDGYPAIFEFHRSETNDTDLSRQYATLDWNTTNYSYKLYQVGDRNSAQDNLHYLAVELTRLNEP